MTKKQKKNLIRIIIALVYFLVVLVIDKTIILASVIDHNLGWLLPFGLYFLVYLFIGYDVLKKAFLNIIHGHLLDENFLMAMATVGAFGLGIYRALTNQAIEGFDEACAVLLFYQVGEWFQSYAVSKSRKSISELMDIRPDFANLIKDDGSIEIVDPSCVSVSDLILIKPGERIPLDGIVVKGTSTIDTKSLTGESLPREVDVESNVISGTINLTGAIEVKVLKEFHDSTVSKILDLVENASSQKSKSENFITRFSKYYTPIVVGLALALAIIPVLFGGNFSIWLYRALSFLVVSCPCALVISIPLSFFAGIGGASRNGILVKGSSYLEKFNQANVFIFDKTGTITKGDFVVCEVNPQEKREEILRLAAIAEENSNHPIAMSIKKAYGKEAFGDYILTDIAGKGIKAQGECTILCGNEKLMKDYGISCESKSVGTVIHVAKDNEYVGNIVIADEIKEESKETITYLNQNGNKTVMLTGDNEAIAKDVACKVGLSEYKASLLPQDKVYALDEYLGNDNVVCFVGDGINDAPALIKSDIGVSMGALGSDAAIEASDIVLMYDDLGSLINAKVIAKKTMRIVYENIIFALMIKILILVLSAFGITNMWFAVFGDVGVAVICIINAMRANVKIKKRLD